MAMVMSGWFFGFFRAGRYVAAGSTAVVFLLAVVEPRSLAPLLPSFFLYLGILTGFGQLLAAIGRRIGSGAAETGLEFLALGCILHAMGRLKLWALLLILGSLLLQIISLRKSKGKERGSI